MNDIANRALLPAGLRDILPPDAAYEAEVVHTLMSRFAGHGYERVKPPLIEFEDSLLTGSGAATASQTFRVLDPLSHHMMGVRADMTIQVARIATTRLADAARPLRLSYAGQVLRVKGTQLRPERQVGQAGLELIGAQAPAGDAEVIVLAVEALEALGLAGISVDLSLPTLVPALFPDGVVPAALREPLDHKDPSAVTHAAAAAGLDGLAATLCALLEASGPAGPAAAKLAAIPLPPAAAAERDTLAALLPMLAEAAPTLTVTIDPVENRGFHYHTGLSFTLFSRQAAGEMGRGGRYLAAEKEPATGVTLFLDTVLGALPGPVRPRRVYLPVGTARDLGDELRVLGFVTIAGLRPVDDAIAEARRLGCGHAMIAGQLAAIDHKE